MTVFNFQQEEEQEMIQTIKYKVKPKAKYLFSFKNLSWAKQNVPFSMDKEYIAFEALYGMGISLFSIHPAF